MCKCSTSTFEDSCWCTSLGMPESKKMTERLASRKILSVEELEACVVGPSLRWWCRASCPRMSADILGTNCDRSTVQFCFTSTETVRLIRTQSPGRPPRLSHSSSTLIKVDGWFFNKIIMHPYEVVFCFVFCFVLLSTVFVLGKTIISKAVNKMNADQK